MYLLHSTTSDAVQQLGTCESAVCVRIESRVESGVKIRIQIESQIESAVGPRRGTARRTTAVGRYRGAPQRARRWSWRW